MYQIKKKIRTLEEFENQCYFFSTESGWNTKKGFLYYSLLIISEISTYRFSLNEKIRDDPILLILDGAPSHLDFLSAYLFYLFNIDLLLIPPHTSHILSAFDVALASPIKNYFSEELAHFKYTEELFEGRKFMTYLRTFVIKSFLSAAHQACNGTNIGSGFRKTGIYPYNPDKPLFTDFSMECNDQLFKNKAKNDLPTYFINSEDGLKYLYEKETRNNLDLNNLKDTFDKIYKMLTTDLNIETGIPLSKLPDILIEKEEKLERLKIRIPK